jgi:hypothetical protein
MSRARIWRLAIVTGPEARRGAVTSRQRCVHFREFRLLEDSAIADSFDGPLKFQEPDLLLLELRAERLLDAVGLLDPALVRHLAQPVVSRC